MAGKVGLNPYFRSGLTRKQRRPPSMSRLPMTNDQAEMVSRLSLEIFADMVNHGQSFEAALTAIYMTGFENAFSAMTETCQRDAEDG